MKNFMLFLALVFLQMNHTGPLLADTAKLVSAASSLAMVTRKEGVASGLAHRHIVVARDWTVVLNLTPNSDAAKLAIQPWIGGTADIDLPVKQLLADDVAGSELIRGLLMERKVWDAENDRLEPSNQAKVTENMLASSQLDAERFPKISGNGSFSDCQASDDGTSQCKLKLTLRIHDKSVSKSVDLTLIQNGKNTTAKFILPLKFTDFGIKPYSAMLGAIRVSDEFVLAGILQTVAL